MSTKHYRDEQGNYIGGFGDGAVPPEDAIEVNKAPNHGTDKWQGGTWKEDPAEKEKKDKKKLVEDETELLFDALLDMLPAEFAARVAAFRSAKLG